MKLSTILLAQAVSAKTDVHFNRDHEFHQVAELEKWEALADKWFRLHGDNLRKSFLARWSGPNGEWNKGRFQKEINKLKKSFARKCSNKYILHDFNEEGGDHLAQPVKSLNGTSIDDETFKNTTTSDATRERRSSENTKQILNSGDRIRHVVRNIEQWAEATISTCPNTKKIIKRWQKFAAKWERELKTNPIFQEEIEEEKRNFRSQGTGDERCGIIFTQFGLHGRALYLYDAAVDPDHGIDSLGDTDFGNDELMSMKPLPGMRENSYRTLEWKNSFQVFNFNLGCYIRAYQHNHKEGYSSICDDSAGCSVVNSRNGPLTENEGSSVYCYCEAKSKFHYQHEDSNVRYLLNLSTATMWNDLLER